MSAQAGYLSLSGTGPTSTGGVAAALTTADIMIGARKTGDLQQLLPHARGQVPVAAFNSSLLDNFPHSQAL